MIRDISQALAHLHRHNVIHGSVRPANILITSAGVVKLADLPIVRDGNMSLQACDNWHIAPEVAAGNAPSPAADLYSLGTAAFEAAHGEAFAQQDITIKQWLHSNHSARFASGLDGWSPRLRAVMSSLLEPDPARRATAEELVEMEALQSLPPTWLLTTAAVEPESALYWE